MSGPDVTNRKRRCAMSATKTSQCVRLNRSSRRAKAADTETGKIAWTVMTKEPLIGGALATAGNLAFFGEGNGWFNAVDAKTGKNLWRYNLGAGVNAPPITYEVNGHRSEERR